MSGSAPGAPLLPIRGSGEMAVTPLDVASGRGNAAGALAVMSVHGYDGPLGAPAMREPTASDVARRPGGPTWSPLAHGVARGRGNAAVASAVVPVHGHDGPLEVPVMREPTASDVARESGGPRGSPLALDVASGRGNATVLASAVVSVHGHGGPLEVPVMREPTAGDVARAPGEPTGLPTAHAGSAVLGTTVVGSRHDRMPTLAQRMGNGTAFVTAPPAVSGGRGVAGAGVQ